MPTTSGLVVPRRSSRRWSSTRRHSPRRRRPTRTAVRPDEDSSLDAGRLTTAPLMQSVAMLQTLVIRLESTPSPHRYAGTEPGSGVCQAIVNRIRIRDPFQYRPAPASTSSSAAKSTPV